MIDGLPLLVLVFFTVMVLLAFWRLILMIFAAAFLTLLTVGVIDVVRWLGEVL